MPFNDNIINVKEMTIVSKQRKTITDYCFKGWAAIIPNFTERH